MNSTTFSIIMFTVLILMNIFSYILYYNAYYYYGMIAVFIVSIPIFLFQIEVIWLLTTRVSVVDNDNKPYDMLHDISKIIAFTFGTYILIAFISIIMMFVLYHNNFGLVKSISIPFLSFTSIFGAWILLSIIQQKQKQD